jgi:hypothetical protein
VSCVMLLQQVPWWRTAVLHSPLDDINSTPSGASLVWVWA